jgi:hypothetical protein
MTELDIDDAPNSYADDGWLAPAPPHRQIQSSRGVLIDEGIAELVEAVWRVGIDTSHSCQGGQAVNFEGDRWRDDDVRAYILFPTVDDALSFMRRSATQLGWTDHIVHELQMALAQPVSELDGRPVLSLFDSDAIRATVRWPIGYTYALTDAWKENPACDHLGYLRVQRRIAHMGREDVVIGQLVGIIRRLLDYSFDSDFEDADAFLTSWIKDIADETQ